MKTKATFFTSLPVTEIPGFLAFSYEGHVVLIVQNAISTAEPGARYDKLIFLNTSDNYGEITTELLFLSRPFFSGGYLQLTTVAAKLWLLDVLEHYDTAEYQYLSDEFEYLSTTFPPAYLPASQIKLEVA